MAVLQRRSRVLLTSPKTKCKLTRRPLDVYSAPRIPPREIRSSPFNNNRACIFLSLERHRVLRISLTCPVNAILNSSNSFENAFSNELGSIRSLKITRAN